MGALLNILELIVLVIASFIFVQTVELRGGVMLLCTVHKDEGKKDVVDVL
jgi:hypothetical protein